MFSTYFVFLHIFPSYYYIWKWTTAAFHYELGQKDSGNMKFPMEKNFMQAIFCSLPEE